MANDDLDLDEIDPDEHDNPNVVRRLRDMARNAQNEAAEGRRAQRELAFVKAGVDTETPQGKLLMKGYDGKLDVELIRAEWDAVKPMAATPQPAEQAAPEATPSNSEVSEVPAAAAAPEPTGSAERRALADGAAPAGTPSGDVRSRVLDEARERQQVGDADTARGGFVNGLVNAWASGELPALDRFGRRA